MRVGLWAATAGMLAGIWVAGCAAQQKTGPDKEALKHEIIEMWKEIRRWRGQAGMDRLEPTPWEINQWRGRSVADARATCTKDREPKAPACNDVCSIADNICNNAEDICRIADGPLRGDPWAKGKCDSAKASCKGAKKRCCKCNGSQKSSESGFIDPSPVDD